MPFEDIREFIAKLEAEGEVQRIEEEVDWNLEAAAIQRRGYEENLPIPFFQKIKDYPAGFRLIGGGVNNYRRIAIAFGLPPNTHPKEIIEEYLKRKNKPIKPVIVKDGPCKENIRVGKKVDLFELPIPMVHQGDGGRYLGTWHMTISKELGGDWVNWGMYRHMVHDKNKAGILMVSPQQHVHYMFHRGYEPKGKPMDVAIVIGVEPMSTMCALTPMPHGVSEANIAGGLRGEPVKLVKCETSDLYVPASAEIVVEGEMRPNDKMDEGPFGEYTGYMAGGRGPRPVIHVKAITFRNNPIFTFCCQGIPATDSCAVAITAAAETLEILRSRGIPVVAVSIPPEAANVITVVAVKNTYGGLVDDVIHTCWSAKRANGMPYIFVVEDDVDPFNIGQVLHVLATKCHPYKGITRLEHAHSNNILPFLTRQEQTSGLGAKAYFDCTWPRDWDPKDIPIRVSFDKIFPEAIQKKALKKWHKYGY